MLKSRHSTFPSEQLPGQYKNKQLFPTTTIHTHIYIYKNIYLVLSQDKSNVVQEQRFRQNIRGQHF